MKPSTLTDLSGRSKTSTDDQMTEALADALASNDKTIEIRPADRSRGGGLSRLVVLAAAVAGLAYWLRSSRKTDELFESAREGTADRTKQMSEQAAETIERGSETAADRIETGSEQASEAVEEAGEMAAERTESAGDTVADETDDTSSSHSGS